MPLPSPLRLRWARLRSAVWRLRTLPYSEALFAGTSAGTRLARPFAGGALVVDVGRSSTERLIWLEGERMIAERHLLAALLRPGMHVADVGANLGYYMLLFARAVGPAGRIDCFEPEPGNLETLALNVRENRLEGCVRIHPVAAGDVHGFARLAPGLNGVVTESGEIEVPLRRLDDLIEPPLGLLKIDVEGFEGPVLRGAARLLREAKPALFVEIHPDLIAPRDTVRGLLAFLRDLYPRFELWEPSGGGPAARLAARYLSRLAVRRIADSEALCA
ncbi:MAG: FkbM family methyltransferase, partial [Acidobacteriota bacterium]